MKGLAIFLVFFLIFLASSFLISSPLFPGNVVCFFLGVSDLNEVVLISAVVNGVFYGFVAWVIFSLSFRWVERSVSKKKLIGKRAG